MVANHYERLEFQPFEAGFSSDPSSTTWYLDLSRAHTFKHHIKVAITNEHRTTLQRTHERVS